MAESLFSSSWYRVENLRPRLRSHVRIHRHVYRGEPWYILQDVASQRFHRFSPAVHALIGLMDGERTLQEIWRTATETMGDDAPTQEQVIRLLAQLHFADALQSDVSPDATELFDRVDRREKRERIGWLLNPFAIRVPLFDPDRVLTAGLPYVRPLLGWVGALLWFGVVSLAVVLVGLHWSELTEGFLDRLLSGQNLLIIWLLFPLIKTLHEFGHGFAAKSFGGEIHDMGIMLLVFTPVPYVEASSASAFPEKRRRALVGAAGMLVEVFIASLAVLVWVAAEPGALRSVAYNAMLIGGVTTLAFNANPLLRFDGYYILADLIEMPNLRQRANKYIGYLVERYAFGRQQAENPAATRSERVWFAGYASASLIYRVFVVAAILLFVLDVSLVLGTILVSLAVVTWFGLPLSKGIRFLVTSPHLRGSRPRALLATVGMLVLFAALLLVPLPFRTQSEGVVWIPEEALVRAGSQGVVQEVVAQPGSLVRPGDLLIVCRDPDLEVELRVLEARLQGLDIRYAQESTRDHTRAQLIEESRRPLRKEIARVRERRELLDIRSGAAGRFVSPRAADLPGRFVEQGTLLGHVVRLEAAIVRAVVTQEDIDLLRRTRDVKVRLVERLDEVFGARVARVVPAATAELPSTALGESGGGQVVVDPRDESGGRAMEKLFVVELALLDNVSLSGVGGRVHIRFDHGHENLAARGYRRLRQLFLSRLEV